LQPKKPSRAQPQVFELVQQAVCKEEHLGQLLATHIGGGGGGAAWH
jgi:hypothetical protein